jgi:hypothetical protein
MHMHTPVIPEKDGQEEEMTQAGLVSAKPVDSAMRWLPIQEYEDERKVQTPLNLRGKDQ